MKTILRYLLFTILALAPARDALLRAQPAKVPADSARVMVRSLPAGALKKYRDDDAFDYRQQRPEGMSVWDRFWLWVFSRGHQSGRVWEIFIKVLLWTTCLVILVYTIIKFVGMSGVALFTGHKKAETPEYTVTGEDIYAIDFRQSIQEAIAAKNYRLAVRLLYLQTLRGLADRDLIQWKINKTNDSYAQELAGSDYYHGFARLTRVYDYAWYGDFPVHEELFADVQQYFQTFQRQLL